MLLGRAIGGRGQLLVVLDNFEQIVDLDDAGMVQLQTHRGLPVEAGSVLGVLGVVSVHPLDRHIAPLALGDGRVVVPGPVDLAHAAFAELADDIAMTYG